MKINNIGNMNKLGSHQNPKNHKANVLEKENVSPGAVFQKSKAEDKSHVYDKGTIDKLKKEGEKSYDSLKKLVADMLRRQGKGFNLQSGDKMIEIDETTRAEAKALISPEGPLGIEAVSDSIVDFAKAVSGGDKSKLDTLIGAIDKGFREAEKVLGSLPEISMKTYDRIMEKLQAWKEEGQ